MLLPGSSAQGLLASVAQELPPVAGPSDQETIRFYRMGEAERARLLQRFTQLQPPAILKNGLRLTGFSIQQDKNDLNVILCWRVDDASATAGEYTVFVHLLNKESQLQAQHDQPFAPHATWHSGDTILSFYRLSVPAALPSGQYNLNTGMYLPSPGTPRVPVRRGDTQLPGDVVTLDAIHLPVAP